MQTWKRSNGKTLELSLTAGVALRLEGHFENLAILENPAYVLGNLHSAKVLLPVAIAMSVELQDEYPFDEWQNFADELGGEKYESLRAAVEAEILDFFQGETRSRLKELIELNQQEARNAILTLRREISQETDGLSGGGNSSGNGQEPSAATGGTALPGNSSIAAGDGTGSSGTTQQPSSPPSPANDPST